MVPFHLRKISNVHIFKSINPNIQNCCSADCDAENHIPSEVLVVLLVACTINVEAVLLDTREYDSDLQNGFAGGVRQTTGFMTNNRRIATDSTLGLIPSST